MYENIGGKIKWLAKVMALIESVLGVILGIALLAIGENLLGIIIIIVSPIFTWISSWVLYGIGQAAENIEYLKYCMYNIMYSITEKTPEKNDSVFYREKNTETVVARREEYAKKTSENISLQSEQAIVVEVNGLNECICPKCQKSLSFDSMVGIKQCAHCKSYLKLVKKKPRKYY